MNSHEKHVHIPKIGEESGKEIDGQITERRTRVKTAKVRPQSSKKIIPKASQKSQTTTASITKEESKEESLTKEEEEKKKRLSYDEWVAAKRKQDEENMKRAMKKKEEEMRKSDAEMNDCISKVGQNRVSRILEEKKRIETGVKKIDKMANAGFRANRNADPSEMKESEQKSEDKTDTASRKRVSKRKNKGAKVLLPAKRANSPPMTAQPVPPATPKPNIPTERKQKVKYAERSWDQFSNYVWDKLNETGGDMERPEPQGSEKPDLDPHNENSESSSVTSKQPQGGSTLEEDDDVKEGDDKKLMEKGRKTR